MGAAESTTTGADGQQTFQRRRYCGNFLGMEEESTTKTPASQSRSIAGITGTASPPGAAAGSPQSPSLLPASPPGSPPGSPPISPLVEGRSLSVTIPGETKGAAMTEGERQLAAIEAEKQAKRNLRRSQQINKKIIKQIKKETIADERERLREERAAYEADLAAKKALAAVEFENKSWAQAIEAFRAERLSKKLIMLPPTFDAAVKYLSSKENKRKLIILRVLSLDRCELGIPAATDLDADSKKAPATERERQASLDAAIETAQKNKLATEKAAILMTPKSGSLAKQEAELKMAAAVAAAAPPVVDVPLKDAYAFKFAIRNPSNGAESTGEAWSIVYKTMKSDQLTTTAAAAESDIFTRECVVGETIGGWTKKN